MRASDERGPPQYQQRDASVARGGPTVPSGGQATITARCLASRSGFKRSSSLFRNSSCAVPTLSAASVLASCLGEMISGQLGIGYGDEALRPRRGTRTSVHSVPLTRDPNAQL